MKPVPIGLVGVGGYAANYLRSILKLEEEGLAALASVAIRTPGKYPREETQIAARGVPIRRDLAEMIEKDGERLELAAIPTGIDSHRELMIQAVEAGLDVVLEKPPAATVQDVDAMLAALERTGRTCQVGFQSQSNPTVQKLKRAICDGRLGRVTEAVVKGRWVRGDDYYKRTPWAGKLMLDGRYVLDGTINNPMAHYLFNALYYVSMEWGQAAAPQSVRAELYRGHEIESEDTSCLEVVCENGARVHFYGTLCAKEQEPLTITVVGERGSAVWTEERVEFFEGAEKVGRIGPPERDPIDEVFRNAVRHLRGEASALNCPLAMTRAHTLAVNGAFASAGLPQPIPKEALESSKDPKTGATLRVISGIKDLMDRAAAARMLYSDLGVEWAVRTAAVQTKHISERGFQMPKCAE